MGLIDRALGKLIELPSTATDIDFARCIADVLLAYQPFPPFKLSINHNVKGAKAERPPVFYNWQLRNMCGVETNVRDNVYTWIVDSLILGYEVTRHLKAHTETSSIKVERNRAEYRERPREVSDEIPF